MPDTILGTGGIEARVAEPLLSWSIHSSVGIKKIKNKLSGIKFGPE